jgi:hypothetical protein
MSNTLTPNALRAVKERQQATWSAGEYAVIGTSLQIMGERLCEAAVQIAARHADPRTTAIYDRPRQNFDRHAAYVVVAFVAGGGSRPSNLKRHFGHAASDSRPRVLGAPEPSSIAPRAV